VISCFASGSGDKKILGIYKESPYSSLMFAQRNSLTRMNPACRLVLDGERHRAGFTNARVCGTSVTRVSEWKVNSAAASNIAVNKLASIHQMNYGDTAWFAIFLAGRTWSSDDLPFAY
jgi:hypothetical protein